MSEKLISSQQAQEIGLMLNRSLCSWIFTSNDTTKIHDALKLKFNIANINQLKESQYYEALELIELIKIRMLKVTAIISDFKTHALRDNLLGSAPLPTAIVKQYRAQLDELPPIINWAQMVQDLETAKQAGKQALEVCHA
jgi:hypothetical protein